MRPAQSKCRPSDCTTQSGLFIQQYNSTRTSTNAQAKLVVLKQQVITCEPVQ